MSRRAALALIDRAVSRLELARPEALDRRRFLLASGTSLAAALLAACDAQGPASARRLLRFAERKNEGVERWLLRHTSMDHAAAGAADAGRKFPAYYIAPTVPVWDAVARGPWALQVDGLVTRPLRLSLDELVRLPQTQQRVDHFCVEGWNAVATWWGVRLRELARIAGVRPEARYVDFQTFDRGDDKDFHESWDLESALHPQTLVAYAKDGAFLPPAYGAPARIHSPV